MKREMRAAALSAALMMAFAGCGGGQAEPAAGVVGDSGTAAESALEVTDISEAESDVVNYPTEAFEGIEKTGGIVLAYADGGFVTIDPEEYELAYYAQYIPDRESYDEAARQLFGDGEPEMSYEEYVDSLYSSLGIDEQTARQYEGYEAFVAVSYSGSEEADHAAAARAGFEGFVRLLGEELPAQAMDSRRTYYVSLEQHGDVVKLSAEWEDEYSNSGTVAENEVVCLFDDSYYPVGSAAVPRDTESLFIYYSTRDWAKVMNEDFSEDYETAVFECNDGGLLEDVPLDMAELKENLPGLKKLYISNHIPVTGFDVPENFEGLEELDIPSSLVQSEEEIAALSGLSGLKRLRVRDVERAEEILWLTDCRAQTLAISCGRNKELLEFVYSLPGVTELRISASSGLPYLEGIGAMSFLKKLDIRTNPEYSNDEEKMPDLAPLAELPALEELIYEGLHGENFESIGKIRTLKRLSLYGVRYDLDFEDIDLSVLGSCTGIEYLDLQDVNGTVFDAFPFMTSLKTLRLGKGASYSDGLWEVSQISGLEELIFENSYANLKGVGELKKLKYLQITDSDLDNLSELSGCPELRTVIIDCEDDPRSVDAEELGDCGNIEQLYMKNAEFRHFSALKEMEGLKRLTVIGSDITEAQAGELRENMPWCLVEITLSDKSENEGGDYSVPAETFFKDDIRVEVYYPGCGGVIKDVYIKNTGSAALPSLTEFIEENGIAQGADRMTVYYPEHGEHTDITELFDITGAGIDLDSRELYLSAFDPMYEDDYIEKDMFRELLPGDEARVLLYTDDE